MRKKFLLELKFKKLWITCIIMQLNLVFGLNAMNSTTQIYSVKDVSISLQLKQAKIDQVLDLIEKQTNFVFVYAPGELSDQLIDINVKNKPVADALMLISKQIRVKFKQVNHNISIQKLDSNAEIVPVEIVIQTRIITGKVTSEEEADGLPGVNVVEEGTTNGTVTDIDGNYSLEVREGATLLFSSVGYARQEVPVGTRSVVNVVLEVDVQALEEVVVIGYGVQKKESVVGSIAQVTHEQLQKTGNVTDLRQAIAGQIPGVVSLTSSGEPGGVTTGESATNLFIRGQTTWNGGQPLVLVDGVERNMNNIDVNEVETISVLKDASATAVFGVKGANGVILITTKRGREGKTTLNVNYTGTGIMLSKQPAKLDSYEAMMAKNEMIEREGVLNEPSWNAYVPYDIVQRYRKPQSEEYAVIYPNVDWENELFKDVGYSHKVTLSARGGSENVQYYGMLGYTQENDMFADYDNGKGYDPNYNFYRFNFRSNMDFKLTNTTKLKFNLSGFFSQKNTNWNNEGSTSRADWWMWAASYYIAPNLFIPMHDDGRWGAYQEGGNNTLNPLAVAYNIGIRETRTTELNSDFMLEQDLGFLTKGLKFTGSFFYDNTIRSQGGIEDANNSIRANESRTNVPFKQIYPMNYVGGDQDPSEYTVLLPISDEEYDWVLRPWTIRQEDIIAANWDDNIPVYRRMVYQGQLNYSRTFGSHNVTGMGVFKREENASGSEFKRYREDWVFRTTYDYDARYFLELNGAYNGSEKFGPGYRFDFFPSMGVSWNLSNEDFFKVDVVDILKLRYSIGKVGDDNVGGRWLYSDILAYGSRARLSSKTNGWSPYYFYREKSVGNPDVQWETALKSNIGMELGLFKSNLTVSVDYYTEDRTDIFLSGGDRAVPSFFGTDPPSANLGRVKSNGFEIELGFNKALSHDLDLWATLAISHNQNEVIERNDPPLQFAHLKRAGYPIGQQKRVLATEFYDNWDEVYASIPTETNDLQKLPGYYDLIDFTADGVIKSNEDAAPVQYSTIPQNTGNLSLGANFKNFGIMVQLYGVNNANRYIPFNNYENNIDIVFGHVGDYWSKDNPNASSFLPRWQTQAENIGHYYLYDASFLRLRTVELSYTFDNLPWVKNAGINNMRMFVNGNNLLFWSKLPDDRETTHKDADDTQGAYPTTKRINVGIELAF